MVTLRPYGPADSPLLLALFLETVRRVNARDYTPAQVRAWAPEGIDPDIWAGRFEGKHVVVAEEKGSLVGFADLEPDGNVDRFFVSADRQRQGVGGILLGGLVAEARRRGLPRLSVEASITARPFFEAQGFVVLAKQVVMCRGVELVNFRMERVLVG